MSVQDDVAAVFAQLIAESGARDEAQDRLYTALCDSGTLSKVTVHRYQCLRGCQIATVFRAGGSILCAVRDYKMGAGLNLASSSPDGRRKNTLDGRNHWPSHVYDVERMRDRRDTGATHGEGLHMVCRHWHGLVWADDVLAACQDVTPGHPGAPTRLGSRVQ